MPSANTLEYKITVKHSFCAAVFIFALYSSVILLLLLIFSISWLTLPLFLLLLAVAISGAVKAYRQRYHLKLSDSGRVEVKLLDSEALISGVVSTSSFYNALFLSLHLSNQKNFSVVIYRDAVSEPEYRRLARLINFMRDEGLKDNP